MFPMILLSFTRSALYHTFAVCLDGFAHLVRARGVD